MERLVSRTLPPGVRITGVSRVLNLPMWQANAVKRQTVVMRDVFGVQAISRYVSGALIQARSFLQ